MIDIHIKTIPHKEQNYDTVGDYWRDGKTTQIRVSVLTDDRAEMLVAIHELIESFLAEYHGVHWEKIDAFDKAFKGDGEPGDDPKAPYRHEHKIATIIEMLLCEEIGMDWDTYNTEVLT